MARKVPFILRVDNPRQEEEKMKRHQKRSSSKSAAWGTVSLTAAVVKVFMRVYRLGHIRNGGGKFVEGHIGVPRLLSFFGGRGVCAREKVYLKKG